MHTSHVVKVVSRFHCSFSFYHGHLECIRDFSGDGVPFYISA